MAAGDKTGVYWGRRALHVNPGGGLAVVARWLSGRCGCPARGGDRGGAVARMVRGCGGFGLTCRLGVLLSGISIDGSLWYGDLPAPDGARDDRHSRTFSWRA